MKQPDNAEALVRAGKFAAELEEIERCWDVMHSALAVARPRTAWALLPLGWSDGETIDALTTMPPETAPDTRSVWEHFVMQLGRRRAQYNLAHQEWIARDVTTEIH